jgi:hypothetical protein
MKHRRTRMVAAVAAAAALAATALLIVVPALATTPRRVTTTTFGIGRFDNIDANTLTDLGRGQQPRVWRGRIKTRGHQTSTSCRTRSHPAAPLAGTATPASVS